MKRKAIKIFGREIISWGSGNLALPVQVNPNINTKILPPGRVSSPTHKSTSILGTEYNDNEKIINPVVWLEFIPLIRKYIYSNPNLSQALNNIVELGNTGHTLHFDASVNEQQAIKMRAHLDNKKHQWFEINAGVDGFVNKMISQIMVGGALSVEWIPDLNLKGIKTIALVDPEYIRWSYNKATGNYKPYQKLGGDFSDYTNVGKDWVELNPNTFKYHALNGDTDNPYGIPPYLPALDTLETQKLMLDNVKFIVEQIGIMGFLQVMMDKPEQLPNENYDVYKARLETFLGQARDRVKLGYRDGISVGYKDDTEFDFHATSKNFDGVDKLFQLNEVMFASGLKQDASMLGRNYGTTESQITVVFSKLLAQLKNIQNLIKYNLEFGYSLELRLAGFKFNTLTVEFNPSTAVDKLKEQQADEIKIRNLNALYLDGIISQTQYAIEMGYEKPDKDKPRFIRGSAQTEAEMNAKRNKDKKASDGNTKRKSKALPKEPKTR